MNVIASDRRERGNLVGKNEIASSLTLLAMTHGIVSASSLTLLAMTAVAVTNCHCEGRSPEAIPLSYEIASSLTLLAMTNSTGITA
ncbi:MAG: hypothetical protein KJ967_01025 [Elusimicrobia bacterium]|nr:hypothetical protein [Elusimicrobiota bacterium]